MRKTRGGIRTYTGGREARVLVKVRRDRRSGHQAVHDDSRMADVEIPAEWMMKKTEIQERKRVAKKEGGQKGVCRWGEEERSREAVEEREALREATHPQCAGSKVTF